MGLIGLRETVDGWTIMTIIGPEIIPDYDTEEVCKGMSESAIRREVFLDWTASAGKSVYPEFGPIHKAINPLPFDPERPLICGWDLPAGTGGTPAFVPTQMAGTGQWFIYPEIVGPEKETMGIYEFGEWVAEYLYETFCVPHNIEFKDLKLIHYGDPAGNCKPPLVYGSPSDKYEVRSAFEILKHGDRVLLGRDRQGRAIFEDKRGRGWLIRPGVVALSRRIEAVRSRLTTLLRGGLPALVVDPRAQLINEGFGGAYSYSQRTDGRYELDPAKNRHSHPMNALEYAASRLFSARLPEELDEDEDDRPKSHQEFMTRGAGRRF